MRTQFSHLNLRPVNDFNILISINTDNFYLEKKKLFNFQLFKLSAATKQLVQ